MLTAFRWCESEKQCRWLEPADVTAQVADLSATPDHVWVDLHNPTDEEINLVFDRLFPVHALTLEDITRQRRDPQGHPHLPKVEEFPDYLFVVVNPLTGTEWPTDGAPPLTTQLSTVLTHTRLITFREGAVPAVDGLRQHLQRHGEQGRRGPDYLFHLILDAMVDEYAPLLDGLAEQLDALEDEVFGGRRGNALSRLLHLKRWVTVVRKTLVYEREVLARLSRGEFELIDERETVYYRNVYDHLVRFTELTEASREMVGDLLQSHLSVVSNRLNEVMKALTMISTIVLPMSIVTGLYGMNFEYLPLAKEGWGFWAALAATVLLGLAPLAFFKWKRWV
jgi:magnesium transporter